MEINLLEKEYYKNFDLDVLQSKLNFLIKKLSKVKSNKYKKDYNIELYASYMQIIEIFCINAFAVSDGELLKNIFLSNKDVVDKIKSRFFEEINENGDNFIFYFLKSFVFMIKDDKKDRVQQIKDYHKLITESVDDYLKDSNFLNAYKHGFRVYSTGSASFSVGLTSSAKYQIGNYSSSVSYYIKGIDKKIIKRDIYFNWERVYIKTSVLINTMENMKKNCVYQGKTVNFKYIEINDRPLVDKAFGCFRVSS